MYDVKVLEKQWKRYKVQQSIPWIVLGAVVCFLVVVTFVATYSKSKNSTTKEAVALFPHESFEIATLEQNKTIPKKSITLNQDDELQLKETLYAPDIPVIFPVEPLGEIQTDISAPKERVNIDIQKTSALDALEEVKKRFLSLKDPNDALFLATTFYEQGQFEAAHDWAVEVNKITQNIEESWLVLGKSKAKLGHKKEAVDLLRAYAQQNDSQKALDLAVQIEQGQL